jgi:hypothetical protein
VATRRLFIGSAAALPFACSTAIGAATIQPEEITGLFARLPGEQAIKMVAHATDSSPQFGY